MVDAMHPTPALVAAQLDGQRMRGSDEAIRAGALGNFPDLVWLVRQAGASIDAQLSDWIDQDGAGTVADWIDPEVRGFRLISRWDEAKARRAPLLAVLIQEKRLSAAAYDLGPYFRSRGLSLADSLVEARERVAQSALDVAFAASWNNRIVFNRALQLARTYLIYLMDKARLDGIEPKRSLLSRFGISTVLAARFGQVRQRDLEDACEALHVTHTRGADNALSYFIEGCLWRYDLFADLPALQAAARVIGNGASETNKDANWYLNCAEVWLKLAGETRSAVVRAQCLRNGHQSIEGARLHNPIEAETILRIVMLDAVLSLQRVTGDAVNLRGLRFPFCLRTPHVELPDSLPRLASWLADAISQDRNRGKYVFRDVLAELYSYLARCDSDRAVEYIALAIRQRDGGPKAKPLRGSRSELAQAEDQLLLARLSGRPTVRRQALGYLGTTTKSPAADATRLVVMAQDVESQGSVSGPLLPINQGLALAARNGDASPLFATAARFAVNSHELERRRLGGRGSVIVLQDAEDSIGQSFVFKRLSSSADLADRTRTESLFQQIEAHGARHQFGVVDHLTTIPATMPGVGGEPGDVVSVRRFRQGQTLEEAIHAVPSRAEALVGQAASFLAMFHSKGSSPGEGLRRCLWEKELGRWLRAMFSDEERAAVFQEWWELVRHAPVLDRRDAHALNWLVDTKGRILAVDMDAKGCRPFGYELAQLIEDIPWLAPSDWDARRRLLDRYVKSLNSYGWRHQIGFAEARELLAAGVLARALWLFSHPSASSETRMRAGQLIDAVAFEHGGTPVGRLASRLSARWVEIAGVGSGVQELVLTIPERRRISRAMAFHLRHDPLAPATKDGWVHVEELALLLTASGHRVTPETLLLIAGAAGEPRFERDSFDIRATYGHSVERAIPYESKTPPINLYHATPLGNLQSIFEARAGLNKGKRQWVHLSDSPATALNASNRQQKPVALLRVKARRVGGIVYASGTTWLAPHVQPDVLEVLTLQEVQDVLTVSDPI